MELFQGVGAAVHSQDVAAFRIINLDGMAVVFNFYGARTVINLNGRQSAGNGFGNVYRRLVLACRAQAELFRQVAPAFGRVMAGLAPMGMVMSGSGNSCTGQQQDSGQAR